MKASELRIGNWFKEDILEQTFAQITAEQILDFYDDPLDDFYKPIPLTKEWLLKFEFKKKHSNYIIEAGDYFHSVKKDGEEWIYSYDESDACCYELRSIKYVHQLQNLYFALNDKEL
jgi:hypothetical protein